MMRSRLLLLLAQWMAGTNVAILFPIRDISTFRIYEWMFALRIAVKKVISYNHREYENVNRFRMAIDFRFQFPFTITFIWNCNQFDMLHNSKVSKLKFFIDLISQQRHYLHPELNVRDFPMFFSSEFRFPFPTNKCAQCVHLESFCNWRKNAISKHWTGSWIWILFLISHLLFECVLIRSMLWPKPDDNRLNISDKMLHLLELYTERGVSRWCGLFEHFDSNRNCQPEWMENMRVVDRRHSACRA